MKTVFNNPLQDALSTMNEDLKPKIWGVNNEGKEVKEGDKLFCGDGRDTWNTHVLYNKETKQWHRERDYQTGKIIGSYN